MSRGRLNSESRSEQDRLRALERRLQRERHVRREAEEIAERTTRALYEKQQELQLLEAVVLATNESSTVESALSAALTAICSHTAWPVGNVYLVDETSGELEATPIWKIDAAGRFAALREAAESGSFVFDSRLARQVSISGRPAWTTRETADWAIAGLDPGIRGAFAFPVEVEGRTGVVLQFFASTSSDPDPTLIEVVQKISRQLGRVVERIRAQERVAHQARHDELTGLGNRALLQEHLEVALARSTRHGALTALLFLDLDRFKEVNDTLGHGAGDQLLVDVARRLRASLRLGDVLARSSAEEYTLSRFGGDEFVVLCEGLGSDRDAVRIAERIHQGMVEPFVLDGKEMRISASVGIALDDAATRSAENLTRAAEDLMRDADIAMYHAKQSGRGRWQIYNEQNRADAMARIEVERALREAIGAPSLMLHYQPIVNLTTGRVHACEALLRWERPDCGTLLPAEFIPIAEESSLILDLGAQVLREACRQAARWRAELGDQAPLPIDINMSARQLAQVGLPEAIAEILQATAARAEDIVIEVTETALIGHSDAVDATLQGLRSLGVRIVLDDFGTGYSSLSHLRRFRIDALKIDRSFITHLSSRGEDFAIVQAIAAMASALGIDVVAEGVESEEQAECLRRLGCGWAQGYLFGRPMAAEELELLIRPSG